MISRALNYNSVAVSPYWKVALFQSDHLPLFAGDRAIRDSDGYFYFVGRSDDVILSAGLVVNGLF